MRSLSFWYHLCQSKIGNSDVAIHVHKNIFWLDIAIDDIAFVQIAEAKEYLAEVELGQLFRELALLEQVGEKLTACADVHDEEEL